MRISFLSLFVSVLAFAQSPLSDKSVLVISYVASNSISPSLFEESFSFENSAGLYSDEDIRKLKEDILNASNTYSMYVDVKSFQSIFEIDDQFVEDEDDLKMLFVKVPFGYTHLQTKTYSGCLEIGNTQRFFLKDIPPLKWKITKETKNIGDWTCTKAIPENDFMPFTTEVWFTGDVPIPCGPMHYFGLPGLVVEVVVPEIARITFSGMKHSDKGKEYIKSKAETYRRELEKKKEKTTSWEEVKAQFGLIAKQMGH